MAAERRIVWGVLPAVRGGWRFGDERDADAGCSARFAYAGAALPVILVSLSLQTIRCEICGEEKELRRRVLEDTEATLILVEDWRREHEPCEEYPHNPRQAMAARRLRKALAPKPAGRRRH